MEQKPWHQKPQLDHSFPFRLWDSSLVFFSFHWHEFLEIVYVLEGEISVSVNGTIFAVRKGDITVINSGAVHGFFNPGPGTRITIFQIGLELFDRSLVDLRDRATQKLIFDRKTYISREAEGELHRKLESLLLSIRREFYEKSDGFHLAIRAGLCEIALVFLRELPAVPRITKELEKHYYNKQILERVFSYIHANMGDSRITLNDAAGAAALSKFYFARFFREQTGQTFHTYLSQVRINQAKEHLIESRYPVTEIAYLCGFSSIKTFNRLFKTFTGVAPSTYRNGKKDAALLSAVPDLMFN